MADNLIRRVAVKAALKLGIYKRIMLLERRYQEYVARQYFHKYGLEALIQADKAMRSVDSFIFPLFGTLLGAYREKNFIAHDCDIDVGILFKNMPANLDEVLKEYGFEFVRAFYFKDTNTILEKSYEYKKVRIDFFFMYENEDSFYNVSTMPHETADWRTANETNGCPTILCTLSKSEFEQVDFLGYKFYMPVERETWLKEVYGETFMTPIKDFDFTTIKTRLLKTPHIRSYRIQ